MNRLGLIHKSDLDAPQQSLQEDIEAYLFGRYGQKNVGRLADGRLTGPFSIQLHTPALGSAWLGMGRALAALPVDKKHREIVTLVTGGRYEAVFENHAHRTLGMKAGLTESEVELLLQGKKPDSLDEVGKATFDVAYELSYGKGPLDKGKWDALVKVAGKEEAAGLVHIAGFYAYVSVILNGFDAQVPDEKDL